MPVAVTVTVTEPESVFVWGSVSEAVTALEWVLRMETDTEIVFASETVSPYC